MRRADTEQKMSHFKEPAATPLKLAATTPWPCKVKNVTSIT